MVRLPGAGDDKTAETYILVSKQIEKAVTDSGWDGAWFRRAYDDFGDPVGSKLCAEGQIFIEPQGMCIMAGLGITDGRARQALNSVSERLATPHGIMLHHLGSPTII
jgi:cellobiose phosphorylase